jgi:hypothetical protein
MRWTASGDNTFLLMVRPALELALSVIPQPIMRERDAITNLDLIRL